MPMAKKKVLALARGFYGRANSCIKIARMRVEKGLLHAYRGRKFARRNMKALFITRINAGARASSGLPYSELIHGMRRTQIDLNRKMLANLSVNEPYSFKSVVDAVRTHAMLTPRTYNQKGLLATSLVQKGATPVLTPPRPINFFT